MTTLSLNEVLELLDVPNLAGDPRQLEKLRKWIEGLAASRGQEYVRQNRAELLTQWEQHTRGSFKSCL